MTSGGKLFEALQSIIDDLNANDNNDEDIQAIEAENEKLRQKKMQLMANLNRPSTIDTSIVLVRDMYSRQKIINQIRSETRKNSLLRFKDRSSEAILESSKWKQTLEDVDNCTTLPYHDVLDKIKELELKIAENRSVIEELNREHAKLNHDDQVECDEFLDTRFIESLSSIAEEQRKLLETLKADKIE